MRERGVTLRPPQLLAFISSPHCPLPSPHLFICCTPLTGLKWELKSIHMKVQTKAGCVTTILLSQWCILNTIDDFPDTNWANNPITDIMSFNAAYFISQLLLLKMEQNGCLHKSWTNALAGSESVSPSSSFHFIFGRKTGNGEEEEEWDLGMSRARLKHTSPTWAPRLNASDYVQKYCIQFNSECYNLLCGNVYLSIYLEWQHPLKCIQLTIDMHF